MKRREALYMLASTAAGLYFGGVAFRSTRAKLGTLTGDSESPSASDASIWRLLTPLRAGAQVGPAKIVGVGNVRSGAADVEFEDADHQRFWARICLRDHGHGAPTPIAHTERYELFLANGGKGNTPTRESHGLTVMALASHVRKNEADAEMLALTTLRDRWRQMDSRGV
jgi:hypothetical protein